ncbi:AMP-binding protein [Oceanobacillus manasiensis]|uniref:AMP-binding protein n=1 Tax=Oceanobacillus manasiensis TaxID=586413 RepID=UPI0005A7425B|nr:AMP-binding protein [Oceanobacillus manasiensis]
MKKYTTLVESLKEGAVNDKGVQFIYSANDEEFMSYEELLSEASNYLTAFQEMGVNKGDELILQFESERPFLISFWACLIGGIIPVPLPFDETKGNEKRLFNLWPILKQPWIATNSDILKNNLKLFAKENDLFHTFESMSSHLFSPEQVDCVNQQPEYYEPHADDIAYIQFSSGSTGQPKGVIITHKSLLTSLYDAAEKMKPIKSDSMLCWIPLTHTFGFTLFHLFPILYGLNQYHMQPGVFISNPNIWFSFVHKYQVSVIGAPNFGYRHFLKHFNSEIANKEEWDFNCVRMTWFGSENIPISLYNEFLESLSPWGLSDQTFITAYGMTENSALVAMNDLNQLPLSYSVDRTHLGVGQELKIVEPDSMNAIEIVSVGYPIEHTDLRIIVNGTACIENVVGHIELNGPTVTPGYYRNSETTQKSFTVDGWLKTGDIGLIAGGELFVIGRAKDIIIINGKNYFLTDIEDMLVQGAGKNMVGAYVACGVPNAETSTEDLIIFVHLEEEADQFNSIVKEVQLALFKHNGLRAAHVLPIKSIPKTDSNKVQRYKLVENYQAGEFNQIIDKINQSSRSIKQKNKWIKLIKAEVEELTGMTNVSVTTNFFDLGLSSAQLVVLQDQLQKSLGVDLEVSDTLNYPNIQTLANFINSNGKASLV